MYKGPNNTPVQKHKDMTCVCLRNLVLLREPTPHKPRLIYFCPSGGKIRHNAPLSQDGRVTGNRDSEPFDRKTHEAKQADILRHASTLFNREGYQSPSIERIAEHAGISKMTFYRYYADKEALILAILKQKESEFMQDLAQITADKASAGKAVRRVRLLPSLVYLRNVPRLHVYPRAVEYGASSPAIREQCSRFKSLLWQFFRDILLQVLNRNLPSGWP